jgi:4-hydroxy-tetrahydrodipicolinate reductase
MIKIGVVGAAGRMGSLICKGVINSPDMKLSGALERAEHPNIGKDVGEILGLGAQGVRIEGNYTDAFKDCSVIIDFSSPEATLTHLAFSAETGKTMVIGTTGFSSEEKAKIESLSKKVPIVMAPNMSVGVNVMFKVAGILAKLLDDSYDIEIIEAHHKHKKDAPSGTAKGIAEEVAKAKGINLKDCARYERYGMIGERPKGEIGIQTIRAGDIVGEHTLMFVGTGERIELSHKATTRENFANGAIKAAKWVADKKPGIYNMKDVLGL